MRPTTDQSYGAAKFTGHQEYYDERRRQRAAKPVTGNSYPCCGGCALFPNQSGTGLFTAFLVLFPVVVFLTSVIPYDEWWSYLIVGVLTLGAMLMQWFAVTCDPGILPRSPANAPAVKPQTIRLADGSEMEEKVCLTCNIVRPPKSSHCSNCDYCVEEYDHHCGVVGSCVAKRTFRFFTLYFYFLVPLATYIFVRSVVVLSKTDFRTQLNEEGHTARWRVIAAFGCVLYSACAGCCVIGQFGYYTDLSCKNETQKLQVQMRRAERSQAGVNSAGPTPGVYATDVDFSHRRSCGNWCTRLFGPMPPSRLNNLSYV